MASLLVPGVPFYRNPEFKPALDALVLWLMEQDYSTRARWAIYDHAAVHGTLAGSAYLDPGDEEIAEVIFVENLPAVPYTSDVWAREDVSLDAMLLAEGKHPWPIPNVGDDDDREVDIWRAARDWEPAGGFAPEAEEVSPLPPVAGGAEPFEPSDEDMADYAAWAEELDRLRGHAAGGYGYED